MTAPPPGAAELGIPAAQKKAVTHSIVRHAHFSRLRSDRSDAGGCDEGWSKSACLTPLTHFLSPVARESMLAPTMAAKVNTSLSREISLSCPADAIAVNVAKSCSTPV
jgi:hypothetical protein